MVPLPAGVPRSGYARPTPSKAGISPDCGPVPKRADRQNLIAYFRELKTGTFKDSETFMKMGSAGVGLGLGVKDFRAVFVFSEASKLEEFVDKGWDFSG